MRHLKPLRGTDAGVSFVQGSRVAGDQLLAAKRGAAHGKWSLTLEEAKRTEAGNLNAGAGIAGLSHLGHALSPMDCDSAALRHRATFSWVGSILKGCLHLLTSCTP